MKDLVPPLHGVAGGGIQSQWIKGPGRLASVTRAVRSKGNRLGEATAACRNHRGPKREGAFVQLGDEDLWDQRCARLKGAQPE